VNFIPRCKPFKNWRSVSKMDWWMKKRLSSTYSYLVFFLQALKARMLYPRGNSELMCYKLPIIPREIFWKFSLNFVPLIILSCNQISTLKIDSMYYHAKFHKVWSNTWADISVLQITWQYGNNDSSTEPNLMKLDMVVYWINLQGGNLVTTQNNYRYKI